MHAKETNCCGAECSKHKIACTSKQYRYKTNRTCQKSNEYISDKTFINAKQT